MLPASFGIFLLAIAIRAGLLLQIQPSEFLYGEFTSRGFVSGDEGINVAATLAGKGEFADPFFEPTGPTAHVPPAYPFATSVLFRMLGTGHAAAAARNGVNITGYALLYACFPVAARTLGLGARAGVIAGVGAALIPAFRSTEVFRGRDEWAAGLLLLIVTSLAWRMCTSSELTRSGRCGFSLSWGLLLHVQPATISVLPFHCAVWLWHSARHNCRKAVHELVLAIAMIFVILLPWTIRNRMALGAWMFVRDNLGIEMRVSHADGAQPSQAANQASGWYCRVHPICSAATVDEIRRDGEVSVNSRLLVEAKSWIASHPGRFLELTLARIAAFWADLPSNRLTFAVRLCWSFAGFLGLFLMWREGFRLHVLLLGSVLAAYPLLYYLVQYSNRYVAVISFALFLPAGFAADHLFSAFRRWRWNRLPDNRRPAGPVAGHQLLR